MEDQNNAVLRQTIRKAIIETEELIQSLKDKTQPVSPDNTIGRLSRMDAIGNKNVNTASLRNAQSRLTKLKYALSNIDAPGFGLCSVCDEPIPAARIMVVPESTMCVKCAEEAG